MILLPLAHVFSAEDACVVFYFYENLALRP